MFNKIFRRKYNKVIEIIDKHIESEKEALHMSYKQLKTVDDSEAIEIIKNDMKSHNISILTLENLKKEIASC